MKNINVLQNNLPISVVKENLVENKGKSIVVKEYNRQSKRLLNTYQGIITDIYSNLFVVAVKKIHTTQKISIRYSDVSIGIIEYEIVA